MAMIAVENEGDDTITIDDIDDEEFDGVDYSDKNLLIQLLMNQQLSAGIPITSRTFDKYITQHYEVSSVELQGYRDNMEDQHLIHFNLRNNTNCSVFGVFDGHGGDLTSQFVKNSLIELLEDMNIINDEFDDKSLIECVKRLDIKWIEFENKRQQLKEEQIKKEEEKNEQRAIQFTMESDEENGNNNHNNNHNDDTDLYSQFMAGDSHPMSVMSTNEFGSVGSTVVFCIVQYDENEDNYKITTVNLGDSRAILFNHNDSGEEQVCPFKLIELSVDHKPDNDEERERIIAAGGHVKFNRVDGDLALSRAIGDTRYKQKKELPPQEQKISCVPSITREICKSGDYLLVFCDGIVEYKENEDVFDFMMDALSEDDDIGLDSNDATICGHLRESELDYLTSTESLSLVPKHNIELRGLEKALLSLTEWALETGSKDNMTAMIIKIGKTNINNTVYQRIWSPCDFYQYKVQFNNIGEEIKDKDKLTLDRFMRLFEADCSKTGWDLSIKYENALLQKTLYINDLITNNQQKIDIKKLIETQNNKLYRLEQEEKEEKELQSISVKKKRGIKRKTIDDEDGNNNDDGHLIKTSPRKRRRLDTI